MRWRAQIEAAVAGPQVLTATPTQTVPAQTSTTVGGASGSGGPPKPDPTEQEQQEDGRRPDKEMTNPNRFNRKGNGPPGGPPDPSDPNNNGDFPLPEDHDKGTTFYHKKPATTPTICKQNLGGFRRSDS